MLLLMLNKYTDSAGVHLSLKSDFLKYSADGFIIETSAEQKSLWKFLYREF